MGGLRRPSRNPVSRGQRPTSRRCDYANMKDTTGKNQRNRRRKPRSDAFEIGEIRVSSRPGPDARDRLRRIFTILLEHAAEERQSVPEDASADATPNDDAEEEG